MWSLMNDTPARDLRLAPDGTNLGLFSQDFSTFWHTEPKKLKSDLRKCQICLLLWGQSEPNLTPWNQPWTHDERSVFYLTITPGNRLCWHNYTNFSISWIVERVLLESTTNTINLLAKFLSSSKPRLECQVKFYTRTSGYASARRNSRFATVALHIWKKWGNSRFETVTAQESLRDYDSAF